ncbi:winged helix-turn-helix domain-containing protein [Pseudoduganella sp. FT93W]|uniref:Winged helix-turn-helix domain-containing protein n=1 Tax=Duganella fentianensis TaxID=2692177 RepID=A0A845I6G7_9BURK|nr:winged helix-turn-helix domain-containing protein [Duganella fentianensis]MYN47058.1 winged helix-turn-helix domain-containing protein [Duganella fentianensis]
MMPPKRPADIYMRFLQLAEALRGLPSLPPLDPLEERILAIVAKASQEEERLSVRDMMGKKELGAPATVHSRLTSMREKGWLILTDTEDARRKQVELTQDALKYFDKLSKCMVKATQQ